MVDNFNLLVADFFVFALSLDAPDFLSDIMAVAGIVADFFNSRIFDLIGFFAVADVSVVDSFLDVSVGVDCSLDADGSLVLSDVGTLSLVDDEASLVLADFEFLVDAKFCPLDFIVGDKFNRFGFFV